MSRILQSIKKPKCFILKDIMESGQAFRYEVIDDKFLIIHKGKRALVYEEGERLFFSVESYEDLELFFDYFDLSHDYERDFKTLKALSFPSEVLEFSKGIRLLNQDLKEVIFTFITSQNNNIKRIKMLIDRLCVNFGRRMEDDFGDYHAFPTIESLSKVNVEKYRELGFGYRDKYIKNAAIFLLEHDTFLNEILNMNTKDAHEALKKIPGVGPKVADCILLYGVHKRDVFPLDTWMEKVFKERFDENEKNRIKMAGIGAKTYGDLAGYAQQLYFFHIRNR